MRDNNGYVIMSKSGTSEEFMHLFRAGIKPDTLFAVMLNNADVCKAYTWILCKNVMLCE